jgi:hypothetical protein
LFHKIKPQGTPCGFLLSSISFIRLSLAALVGFPLLLISRRPVPLLRDGLFENSAFARGGGLADEILADFESKNTSNFSVLNSDAAFFCARSEDVSFDLTPIVYSLSMVMKKLAITGMQADKRYG